MAQQKWLTVIGIEESGPENLTVQALAAIDNAEVIFGGRRHLAMLGEVKARRIAWRKPFLASIEEISALAGQKVVVLASGDPHWFGVGAVLTRRFGTDAMLAIPARSTFSLAAGRLGWSLENTRTLSIHGRPFEKLFLDISPAARLLVLGNDKNSPARIAAFLSDIGFGGSRITVMEHLGGEKQQIRSCEAAGFDLADISDLNVVAIECVAGEGANWFSRAPGLPDHAYAHDGQLTKSVVRAATLAALRPFPGAVLWDVGAGCGSIAIEWMRSARQALAICFEADPERCALIGRNAAALGVPGVLVQQGRAPKVLEEFPQAPDAIFIGGGLTNEGVFEICWQRLKTGGVLVANGVTLEGETRLVALHEMHGGELTRISVEQVAPMGSFRGWKQARPVVQWQVRKAGDGA